MSLIFNSVRSFGFAALTLLTAATAHGDLITGVTTVEGGFVGNAVESGSQTLTSITTGGVTSTSVVFAIEKLGRTGGGANRFVGNGAMQVFDNQTALSDNRIDTGVFSSGDNASLSGSDNRFRFAGAPAATDEVFVIYLNRPDPTAVTLYDNTGAQIGSSITLTAPGGAGSAARFGRLSGQQNNPANDVETDNLFGQSIAIADFNLTAAQLASVEGVTFSATNTFDFALVGIASFEAVPEPSALFALALGAFGVVVRRRRS